jgi:NAD(P)-dependent dehydrogenase (short-subunit alcohol dehydrogenase family)
MATPASSAFYAVISGAGSGTGRSVALRFARAYPVVLLSRKPSNFQPIVDEINASGGKAWGYATDATDQAAVDKAFESIDRDLPQGSKLAAAVFNGNAGFAVKPFLESKLEDLQLGLDTAA